MKFQKSPLSELFTIYIGKFIQSICIFRKNLIFSVKFRDEQNKENIETTGQNSGIFMQDDGQELEHA